MFEECMGCTRRAVGCHGRCNDYIAPKLKSDAIRDKRNHENFVAYGVIESNRRAVDKIRKRRRAR